MCHAILYFVSKCDAISSRIIKDSSFEISDISLTNSPRPPPFWAAIDKRLLLANDRVLHEAITAAVAEDLEVAGGGDGVDVEGTDAIVLDGDGLRGALVA